MLTPVIERQDDEQGEADGGGKGHGDETVKQDEIGAQVGLLFCFGGWFEGRLAGVTHT